MGGAEWSEAKDESDDGDWTSWSIVLEPHNNSGNTTIFARLYLDDDHISPIDAKRVILIDEVATNQEKGLNEESLLIVLFGALIFLVPVIGVAIYFNRISIWSATSDED